MNQNSGVTSAPQIDMGRISPSERALIERMATRFVGLAKHWHGMRHSALTPGASMAGQRFRDDAIELNPTIVAMDLCVVHILRDLDLPAFMAVDDLQFQTEMAWIMKHVNRRLCSFPFGVRLRFARNGERN